MATPVGRFAFLAALRASWPLYALILVTSLTDASIVPLLPTFDRDFGLGHVQTGSLLSVTVLLTIALSVPVGLAVDRVGPRPLLVTGAVAVAFAGVGQALAVDYWTLLGARVVFGLGYGIAWTVVPVLLASGARTAGAAGAALAVGGFALLVGPPAAGFLAEYVWRGAPFLVVTALAAPLAWRLARTRFTAAGIAPQRVRETVALARRQPRVLGAAVLMAVIGLASGTTNLVVPLQLAGNGLAAGAIGSVFSAAGAVSIPAAALASRARAGGLFGVTGGLALWLGCVWLLPVASLSTAALTAFVLLSATARSPLNSVVYVLGQSGAGAGAGAVVGLLNTVWGVTAFAAPLVAGAIAGGGAARFAFLLVAAPALVVGVWLLTGARSAGPGRVEAMAPERPQIAKPEGDIPFELCVEDLVVGDGDEATRGAKVSVHYVGVAFSSGEEFDASWNRGQPFEFRLGKGQVIPGWDAGVQGMRVGGRRKLTIPSAMAYGARGAGGVIKPHEPLVFVVDLLSVD